MWYENKFTRWGMIAALMCMLVLVVGCGEDRKPIKQHSTPSYNSYDEPTTTDPVQFESDIASNKPFIQTSAEGGAGLGVYSVGYRVGQITKFSVKGLANKTGEGQMLMGRESTPYIITYSCGEGSTCRKRINPWHFSMLQRDAHLMKPFAGEYVWVQYNQAQVKSPMYDTDYLITQIGKIDRTTQIKSCSDPNASGSKSEGVRVGRIVKASMKGTFSETGEIMIQVGNAGNQFKKMSVTDSMFQCAVTALKTAQKVKIHYVQSWFRNPFASDTTYAVSKIEVIQDI